MDFKKKTLALFAFSLTTGSLYFIQSHFFPPPLSYQSKNNPHFSVKIEYCVGCGFRHSADLFAKKVKEKYPNVNFNLIAVEDNPGCFEISIKNAKDEEKLIHSAIKGDGRVYLNNITHIIKKLEEVVGEK